MKTKIVLVTGSNGLIGSEVVLSYSGAGYKVVGVDNNMRADFFGKKGDTSRILNFLKTEIVDFDFRNLDIRNREAIIALVKEIEPAIIVHSAAQPSHDLAKDRTFDDFEVNAVGTLNLLEACRVFCPEAPFLFMSTNKVYGDSPNEFEFVEKETRYEYAREEDYFGVSENQRLDRSLHSLFGASKLAADILTQEYGRYFGMPTACFRCGCITGRRQQGVELHGFLNYLAQVVNSEGCYKIFGYKGKQVRDQLHSSDLVRAIRLFADCPRVGEVYNMGGGRDSNSSVLESIELLQDRLGKKIQVEYVDDSRKGDHQFYVSDTRKFKAHFPSWKVEFKLDDILNEYLEAGI